MGTRSGHATDDLLALLRAHCPAVAEAAEAAQEALDQATAGGGDGAGQAADSAGQAADDSDRLRWRRLTLGQIPGLSEVIGVASAPLQVIIALLTFISGILDVVSNLLIGFPDPIRALILAAYKLLKDIIDDFLRSGLYVYVDVPGYTSTAATLSDMGLDLPEVPTWMAGDRANPPRGGADGFERWAYRFEQSFDDPGDDNRPMFSDGAPVEALFIVATAPELVNLADMMRIFGKLFDFSAFDRALDKYLADSPDPDRSRLRATSVAPDWQSWKLRDVGRTDYPLRQLERVPELLKSLLLNVDDIITLIKDLVQAIRDKIELLRKLIEILEAVIDMLKALSATGLYGLAVVTDEGVAGLKKAFLEAENRPNTDSQGKPANAHAILGACLVTGTTNALPIWALLGQNQSFKQAYQGLIKDWKEVETQAEQSWEDTKALATQAWEGAGDGSGSPGDLGLTGLWEKAGSDLETPFQTLFPGLGLDQTEAQEQARSRRNELIAAMEQMLGEGHKLDPRALAHIEATRRARRRGRRSLAVGIGALAKDPQSRKDVTDT